MQQAMGLPLFGIIFAVSGAASLGWFGAADNRVLRALSGVLLAVAALNSYVEGWGLLRQIRPNYLVCLLAAFFLLPYAALVITLMDQLEGMSWRPAIWSSYLPVVCLLFLGLVVAIGSNTPISNRPLSLVLGVALICALHVPMFAHGKGAAIKIMIRSGVPNAGVSKLSPQTVRTSIALLAAPILISAGIQVYRRNDWRLIGADVVVACAILALVVLSRE